MESIGRALMDGWVTLLRRGVERGHTCCGGGASLVPHASSLQARLMMGRARRDGSAASLFAPATLAPPQRRASATHQGPGWA